MLVEAQSPQAAVLSLRSSLKLTWLARPTNHQQFQSKMGRCSGRINRVHSRFCANKFLTLLP